MIYHVRKGQLIERKILFLFYLEVLKCSKKTWNRFTHLRFTAKEGRRRIVKLFIAKRADVNAKNNNEGTRLDCHEDDLKLAGILREYGGKTANELKVKEK